MTRISPWERGQFRISRDMQITETSIAGVRLIRPHPLHDERGFFVRVLSADAFDEAGIDSSGFVQENQSRSSHGTLRGIHLRAGPGEAKTVRCARGAVFDVLVDLRPGSPTFLRWEVFQLDDEAHEQVFVPPGVGHGFQTLSEVADVCYRHDRFYDSELDVAVAYDDPDLAIPWPLSDPIMSARDRDAPPVREMRPFLEQWFP